MQENRLRQLFDLNTIISNPKLDQMIGDTMERYYGKRERRKELTEEEAEYLSAAGDATFSYIHSRRTPMTGKVKD